VTYRMLAGKSDGEQEKTLTDERLSKEELEKVLKGR